MKPKPHWWPRWMHWLYAHMHTYFWLPCPVCGRNFGGHEWLAGSTQSIYDGAGGGIAVCGRDECMKAARESWPKGAGPRFWEEP